MDWSEGAAAKSSNGWPEPNWLNTAFFAASAWLAAL